MKKTSFRANNIKMENNKFKKICIKNRRCYCFNDLMKLEYFDFDKILKDEKSHKNTLTYKISCKTLTGARPLRISFHK